MFEADVLVIGAGAVGLAIAKSLSQRDLRVIILEEAAEIGSNTSRRNSGVIHSGIYYPSGSVRAKLCVRGKKLLYTYCQEKNLPHKQVGKLIVARDDEQVERLKKLLQNGSQNGVDDLQWLDEDGAHSMEPRVKCKAAIFSPSTGIVDLGSLMQAYLEDAEQNGAKLLLKTEVVGGHLQGQVKFLRAKHHNKDIELRAKYVINSAGLSAQNVSRALNVSHASIPRQYYAKGNYFALKGKPPFKHLIYPLPHKGGLGTHLTLDLKGGAKFGPDVEYIPDVDFNVSLQRLPEFYEAIREYWPDLPDDSLQPAFAGIRPKLHGPGEVQDDFLIDSFTIPGFIALYGIESPGLTSSLAIGEHIASLIKPSSRL